jgi:hypothetical protein
MEWALAAPFGGDESLWEWAGSNLALTLLVFDARFSVSLARLDMPIKKYLVAKTRPLITTVEPTKRNANVYLAREFGENGE